MSFHLGLTGSIGMGKSTTAGMFADLGCDVWDADAAVHRLYSRGGAAVSPMSAAFPTTVIDGAVSRAALKQLIARDTGVLAKIEQIVHPLVVLDRAEFRQSANADILVFDIPLLFETGGEETMDAVVVVSVAPNIQESRVFERGSMTQQQFLHIKEKQMSDEEKRRKADFVVVTDTKEHAQQQVQAIVDEIRSESAYA